MTTPGMRVGVICNSLKGGGAEGNASLLVRAWPDSAGRALLIAVSGRGDLPSGDLDGVGVRVLEVDHWPRPRAVLRVMRTLRRAVIDEGLTHLVTNNYGLNQTALLAVRLRLLPRHLVVTVVEHLSLSGRLERRVRGWPMRLAVTLVLRWLYRANAHRVAVSQGVAAENERLLGLPSGIFTVIPNGIDTDRAAVLRQAAAKGSFAQTFVALPRPIVLGIGRLEEQKNFPLLVDAFLRACPAEGSLVILGEGGLRGEIECDLTRRSIAGRVYLPGRVSNPFWYLDRADLFVLSSDFEGYPIVVLEALACGIPIVATDCPWGPAEMLAEVPAAHVVPVRDVNALAQAIGDMLANVGEQRIERVAWDARDMAAAYVRLVSGDRPRRLPR